MHTYIVTIPDAYWGPFARLQGYFTCSTFARDAHDAVTRLCAPIRDAIATSPGDAADYYIVVAYPAMLPTDRRSFAVDHDGAVIADAPPRRRHIVR